MYMNLNLFFLQGKYPGYIYLCRLQGRREGLLRGKCRSCNINDDIHPLLPNAEIIFIEENPDIDPNIR